MIMGEHMTAKACGYDVGSCHVLGSIYRTTYIFETGKEWISIKIHGPYKEQRVFIAYFLKQLSHRAVFSGDLLFAEEALPDVISFSFSKQIISYFRAALDDLPFFLREENYPVFQQVYLTGVTGECTYPIMLEWLDYFIKIIEGEK